ncbi:MAG: hypothetical protein QF561_02705 [Phycisphaerales bacterium]|jgi:hypothetical protein|nr:hypothetical protein [Phycisphaerales bacterium]
MRWWLLLVVGVFTGCVAGPDRSSGSSVIDGGAPAVLERWAIRCEGLQWLRLKGQIQLEWEEGAQGHRTARKEQGDMEVLLDGHEHASLRITKFGDVKFWVGMTPDRYWEFDMISEPSVLRVRPPSIDDGGLMISPSLFRMLLALDPWPDAASVERSGTSLKVTADVIGGTLVATLRASDLRVEQVVVDLGDTGRFTSEHRWTTGAIRVQDAPQARPLASVVDLHVPEALIKVSTSTARAFSEEAIRPVADIWFDLDRVRAHLRPDVVE